MIAQFYAVRIINGNTTFSRVPTLLEEDVKNILEEKGYGHLAE